MPNAVLVTRPIEAGARTASVLRARGWLPILAPLSDIHTLPLTAPGTPGAVLVTSANALPALASLVHLPLLAVGDSTAAMAHQAGFTRVESAGGDAADLAVLVAARHAPGTSLLLATGRGQGHPLAAMLRRAGYRIHRRVVYAARPVSRLPPQAIEALAAGHLHAALFLSAETARIFARLLPRALHPALAGVQALAISPHTADMLAPLPWRQVRVSLGPTLEEVLALL